MCADGRSVARLGDITTKTERESGEKGGLISAKKGTDQVCVCVVTVCVCVCIQQRLQWSERDSVLSLRSKAITAVERSN